MVNDTESDMYPTIVCERCGVELPTVELKMSDPDGPGTVDVIVAVQPAPFVAFIPDQLKVKLIRPKSISHEDMLRKALQHQVVCKQAPSMVFIPHISCCTGDVAVLKTGGRLKMKEPPPVSPPRLIVVPPPATKDPS